MALFPLSATVAQEIPARPEEVWKVQCLRGGTVYVKTTSSVSSSSYDTALAAGDVVYLQAQNYIIASTAGVWVETLSYLPSVQTKQILDGTIVTADLADGAVTSAKLADGTVTSTDIADGTIVNADVNASAAIAYSKLALTNSILNADVNSAAAVAYSKLALTGSIVNADVNASAAVAYSKLALTGSIVNADVNASAAVAYSKLALTNSVVAGDIVNGTITDNKFAANSITNASIASGTIRTNEIADATITTTDISASAAITGTQLASGTVAAGNMAASAVNPYKIIKSAEFYIIAAGANGTMFPSVGGATAPSGTSTTSPAVGCFYFDPANYAISGRTLKLALTFTARTNATSVGTVTFTAGLYPISSSAGGVLALTTTAGTVVSGSTVAITNPGTSAIVTGTPATAITPPSAGLFGLCVVNNNTVAANSLIMYTVELQAYYT